MASPPNVRNASAWIRRNAEIRDTRGQVVFERKGIEVPADWSQLAVDILASKYLRRTRNGHETSLRQVVGRIVDSLGGPVAERKALSLDLIRQVGAFNSPVWFNLGLFKKYGLRAAGGGFRWDPRKRKSVPVQNAYAWPQCSACFIQSVDDDLMSIFELVKTEAWLFKFGSGTGTNFSTLRGRDEALDTGGTSSGLMSFLEVLDRAAGAIKSGGTTRRAAKMVCLDVDHPEILDFIGWKQREERKAAALVRAGFSSDFNGEAYHTVSGQNSNNSVRVTDAFMRAVAEDRPWVLRTRRDGTVTRTLSARELWKAIAEAAWACADPGVQFHDTINAWHTCPRAGEIRASNPCSEYMFLDDSACNLASLNLVKFRDPAGVFDVARFVATVERFLRAQDRLVDLSGYPTARIAENAARYRPLGLGYANLGSLLMLEGLPYESEDARALAAALTALMTGAAYRESARMARKLGPFDGFSANRAAVLRVMKKHRAALGGIRRTDRNRAVLEAAQTAWNDALQMAARSGVRNAQVTVLAPTGTIGLLMDCDTTGIEPDYALVKSKKLAGGGNLTMVNRSVEPALRGLGYSEAQARAMVEKIQTGTSVAHLAELKAEHRAVFACAHEISADGHLQMMAAVQPFLSGAISKTVNLPHSATPSEIADVYFKAWSLGLKSVAIYRDGSKGSQPLETVVERRCEKCGHAYVADGMCARCVNCGNSLGCG